MKKVYLLFSLLICYSLSAQTFTNELVSIGELKGTLSLPKTKTKTAIMLISGSGPTDRDGNSSLGLNNNSLKMIAEGLAKEGFAVLRYDKRGIAESKAAVTNPTEMQFDELISDARNWLNFLSEKGYKRLVIAGHSQGSLVGMVSAQNNKNVKGFISLAGLGVDAGEILIEQFGKQAPMFVPEAITTLDSIRMGHTVNKVNPFLITLFGPQIQGYLRSYIKYNPSEEIKKLSIPSLLVNGTTDIQVGVDQAQRLKEAYPNAQLLIIEGMNHILKDAPAEMATNMATYNNPELPLSNGLMDGILSFIKTL
jgi:uncharacterized protein